MVVEDFQPPREAYAKSSSERGPQEAKSERCGCPRIGRLFARAVVRRRVIS